MSKNNKIWALYEYGSFVYKTNRPDSDYDHILIYENYDQHDQFDKEVVCDTDEGIRKLKHSFNAMGKEAFQKALDDHEIYALECLFLPEKHIVKEPPEPWKFTLDLAKLRASISEKASHSFVKAKKKIMQGDILIGKKSLFHSLRILNFGAQLAVSKEILDYQSPNWLWEEIFAEPSENWEDYQEKYKAKYNMLATHFRLHASKK